MNDLRPAETAFFEHLDIDPAHVGPVIGRGMEHLVRRYNTNEVVKIPRLLGGWSAAAWFRESRAPRRYDDKQREIDLCVKYFDKCLTPTRIQADARRELFCIIQQHVGPARGLNKNLCANAHVGSQAQEIVDANARLCTDEQMYLDLMGFNPRKLVGFLLRGRAFTDNVLITEKNDSAKIIDTGLLPLAPKGSLSPYKRVQRAVQHINLRLMGLTVPTASRRQH